MIKLGEMNSVLISCLLLFVIYFSIVGLLVYYFFRARDTWNIFFNEIYQDFEFLVGGCSKHNTFGLFILGCIINVICMITIIVPLGYILFIYHAAKNYQISSRIERQ